jgi:hypothetical protein
MAAAGFAAMATTPALATTYSLGTLPASTLVSIHKVLSPSNTTDTLTFSISAFGKVFYNLYGRVPNAVVHFFRGTPGSGIPVPVSGPTRFRFSANTGPYYAVVAGGPTVPTSYNLQLKYNPAPVPGPAGLLVFGAGAAVLAYRKRRAQAAAA